MYVKGIQFQNFRNLEDDAIIPLEKINVIYGNNAQGKTNILEALWLFCGGHSFRGSRENEFIKFGKDFAKLKVKFFSQDRDQEAVLTYSGGKKEVFINGVKKNSASSLIGRYTAVIFSPEDLTLVKRGPSARRRFIDSAICREKIQNAVIISRYNQTLNQRNALLKDILRHPEIENMLDIWDDNLISLGAQLIERRMKYIVKLREYAAAYHLGISDNTEKLGIRYNSSCGAKESDSIEVITEKLRAALKEGRRDDCRTGVTNSGPHRDDLEIIINEKKARLYASQGQQRSAVLSLKLAEAKVLSGLIGENPVILLDDVMSELDRKRQDFLFNKLEGYQVFITCCDFGEVEALKSGRKFLIENGRIVRE